jgi:hypothetical protein
MALEIQYPEQKTYFICREDDAFTIQCMITGQPIMDQYLDEAEWVEILINTGKTPEDIVGSGASEEAVAQYQTEE